MARARVAVRLLGLSALVAATGCGLLLGLGDDYGAAPADGAIDAATGDGSSDDAAARGEGDGDGADGGDGAPTGPACDPTKPFGTPTPLSEIDTPGMEATPHLTHDELELYYWISPQRDAGAGVAGYQDGADLASATRADAAGRFTNRSVLTGLNTVFDEASPTITGDDLTVYFASDRPGSAVRDIYSAHRDAGAQFANAGLVPNVNSASYEDDPYVMPDGNTLYLTSDRNGDDDLFVAKRQPSSPTFSPPSDAIFALVNQTGTLERSPVVSLDGRTLYFASDRPGGAGRADVWKSTRASTADPFNAPSRVPELDTSDAEFPGWISDDGCRLYLTRGLEGVTWDLYVATKPPK